MVAETPEITVRDNTESQTYDALIGDQVVGTIVYERSGQRLVFSHTIVEPEFRSRGIGTVLVTRSEEHTSELQSQSNLVCRLLLEKKKQARAHQATIRPVLALWRLLAPSHNLRHLPGP